MRPRAALLLLVVVGCDCERWEAEGRLEALEAEAEAAHTAIEPLVDRRVPAVTVEALREAHVIRGTEDEPSFDAVR